MRSQAVDVAALGALTVLALYGFGTAYGGVRYLVAGVVGVCLGSAIAWWGARQRIPLLLVAAVGLVGFCLFGGAVAVPDTTLAGVLPGPGTVGALIDGAVQGWKRLLTSEPPVGASANLLVVPYLLGMVAALVQVSIALRGRRAMAAVVAPVAVLVTSILFGTAVPADPVLQGSLFAALALWWISHLQRDRRLLSGAAGSSRRWVNALAVLLGAAILATLIGDHIPGAGSHPRYYLREYTDPPPDPSDYPSPLNSYRRYTNGTDYGSKGDPPTNAAATTPKESSNGLGKRELFEVAGLEPDQRLRLAVMDTYTDGVVYEVGGNDGSVESSQLFEKVGDHFGGESEPSDTTVHVKVLQDGYDDVWVPVVDGVNSIVFDGDGKRAENLRANLRVNQSTETAEVPDRVTGGDRYTMTFTPQAQYDEKWLQEEAAPLSVVPAPFPMQEVQDPKLARPSYGEQCEGSDAAASGTGSAAPEMSAADPSAADSAYGRAKQIADNLVACGGFSDGGAGEQEDVDSGHSAKRLREMAVAPAAMVGNGEQFASLAALVSIANGVPARVVMGFRSRDESDLLRADRDLAPRPDGDPYIVRGSDVTAWIEVKLEKSGWVPVPDVTPIDPNPAPSPPPEKVSPQIDPPPPPPSLPPSEEDLADTRNPCAEGDGAESAEGEEASAENPECPPPPEEARPFPWFIKAFLLMMLPFAVFGAVTGLIGGLKSRRRERRRNAPGATQRVDGGWDEIRDLATDLGSPIPDRTTRREGATFIGSPEAAVLARQADAMIFGAGTPDDSSVERYWDQVEATRASMVADLGRFQRWKVLVSLSSLRGDQRRRRHKRRVERRLGAPAATVGVAS